MNRTRASWAVPILAIFLLISFAAPLAHAKAFEVRDEGWEGASEFLRIARAELGSDRIVPRGDLDWAALGPEDALLLVHPERGVSSDRLAAFMRAGGRVAILDDFGASARTLGRFGIQRAPAPTRPTAQLRNNPELAIAEPVLGALPGKGVGVHPAVAGVERLITNHPAALRSAELTPLLRIAAVDGDAIIALAGEPKSATSGGAAGKLIAMSDPSVLINEMLRYPGNRAFASALVRYLGRQDEGGQGKLYIVTNDFVEHGSFGMADLRSDLEARLEALRREAFDLWSDGLSGPLGWGLGALLGLGLAGLSFLRIGHAHLPVPPSFTRPPSSAAQGGAVGRAAVLGAPSTPKALILLELKSALEEALAHRLGVMPPQRPPLAAMLEEVLRSRSHPEARTTLDASDRLAFKEVLEHMSRAEMDIVRGRGDRVRTAVLTQAVHRVAMLLRLEQPLAAPDTTTTSAHAPLGRKGTDAPHGGGGTPA